MNPSLPADYLRSEVLGEFRAGVATFLDPDALEACVVPDRHELPPSEGVRYQAFVDPSGGSRDAFALAIAHAADVRVIVDVVRAWAPPFNPSGVVEEIAAVLRGYDINEVVGDRYAGEWPREQFRFRGIEYQVAELDRSRLYLEFLPRVNAGTVELPQDQMLLRELRGLERRRGPSGRDRIDHRPGEHDDRANAVAGVVQLAGNAPADWRDTFFVG